MKICVFLAISIECNRLRCYNTIIKQLFERMPTMKNMMILALCLIMLLGCFTFVRAEGTADDGVMREGLTSVELTRLMGNGTNLGNTMEACDTSKMNWSADPSAYEVTWGQPITTPEMLQGLKDAGFDTIRIPVAWMTNATSMYLDHDYTIAPAYMARVKEIVDMARAAGMYVIINDHWDGGWWGMFGSDTPETVALAKEAYAGMWTQIAENFKDYSDYVIFEGANEEIGARFDENSKYCSDSVTHYLTDNQRYALANEVNQLFVDTIRATGGNNAQRFLLVPGYGTDIAHTCDTRFKMPTDTAENKLLISVHFYDPWSYCGSSDAAGATAWGTKKDLKTIQSTLAKMQSFVSRGYGVVIGEYGALPGNDRVLKTNSVTYHTFFLDCCDLFDYTACLWDTSGFYVRTNLAFAHQEMGDVYLNRNAASEAGAELSEIKAAASARIDAMIEAAPETLRAEAVTAGNDTAVAWIMWNDGGWSLSYSVGDTYSPDTISPGIKTVDPVITGEGTYTVSLDFTGTQQGFSASTAFSALAIANGETLFPGYVVDITECRINGEVYKFKGRPYTTSDNGVTTRVNLFNEWVTTIPRDKARVRFGDLTGTTATPINRNDEVINHIETIEITFWYGLRTK